MFNPGNFFGVYFWVAIFILVISFFISPVSGDSVFGLGMHFRGSDLDLGYFSFRPENRSVQTPVAIGFGHGDIVLDESRHWFPNLMDGAKSEVTVIDVFYNNAGGDQIMDPVKIHLITQQFLV